MRGPVLWGVCLTCGRFATLDQGACTGREDAPHDAAPLIALPENRTPGVRVVMTLPTGKTQSVELDDLLGVVYARLDRLEALESAEAARVKLVQAEHDAELVMEGLQRGADLLRKELEAKDIELDALRQDTKNASATLRRHLDAFGVKHLPPEAPVSALALSVSVIVSDLRDGFTSTPGIEAIAEEARREGREAVMTDPARFEDAASLAKALDARLQKADPQVARRALALVDARLKETIASAPATK